jgi:serine protease inhibitor
LFLQKGQSDGTKNYVFSPLGYATILSILSQGSEGQTRSEILKALKQPEDQEKGECEHKLVI